MEKHSYAINAELGLTECFADSCETTQIIYGFCLDCVLSGLAFSAYYDDTTIAKEDEMWNDYHSSDIVIVLTRSSNGKICHAITRIMKERARIAAKTLAIEMGLSSNASPSSFYREFKRLYILV